MNSTDEFQEGREEEQPQAAAHEGMDARAVAADDATLPPQSIAALLQSQVAECVGVVRDLAEYAKDPKLISHERIHVVGAIGDLIEQCSNAGIVIAKLHGGLDGTRHTVVVEEKRGGRREGVRKS